MKAETADHEEMRQKKVDFYDSLLCYALQLGFLKPKCNFHFQSNGMLWPGNKQ